MNRITNNSGMALVVTLMIVAICTIVVLDFSAKMRMVLTMAGNFRDDSKAYYLAKGGIHTAIASLREDDNKYDGPSEKWALLNKNPIKVGDGTIKVTVTDEMGKLNLNYLIENSELDPDGIIRSVPNDLHRKIRSMFRDLMELLDVDNEDIDTILDSTSDWLDKDDSTKTEGAEKRYYTSLDNPYIIKNGLLTTISELRLIKGFNDDILRKLGAKEDLYSNIDPGILPHFTVYGNGRININTASKEVIQSLSGEISSSDAEDIVEYRENGDFQTSADINSVITSNAKWNSIKDIVDVKSNYYSIISEGYIILDANMEPPLKITRRIKAVVERGTDNDRHIKIVYWKAE